MTLVLSLATTFYVLQVADRLLTANRREFDAQSNKTVVYRARDAVVSIGFSGPAFLDKVPTDQWIAKKLRGESLEMKPGLRMGPAPQFLDIGQAVHLLATEIDAAVHRRPVHGKRFFVALVGWQWHDRRKRLEHIRPIFIIISKEGDGVSTSVQRLPRRWDQGSSGPGLAKYALAMTPYPNELSSQDLDSLRAELRSTSNQQYREDAMVVAIRAAATRPNPVVGANCMCVRIPPPGDNRRITIAYRGDPGHVRLSGKRPEPFENVFTPWVVGNTLALPPARMVGQGPSVGGYFPYESVDFEATPVDGFGYFATQRRPDDPNP